jgi:predicted transcriptional regulator
LLPLCIPHDAVLPPIRLPKNLLIAARQMAHSRDETLSQVVRRALRAYVARAPKQVDIEDLIEEVRISDAKRARKAGAKSD